MQTIIRRSEVGGSPLINSGGTAVDGVSAHRLRIPQNPSEAGANGRRPRLVSGLISRRGTGQRAHVRPLRSSGGATVAVALRCSAEQRERHGLSPLINNGRTTVRAPRRSPINRGAPTPRMQVSSRRSGVGLANQFSA